MKWKLPPLIKIYEALGAVADGRVEIVELPKASGAANAPASARIRSSTGNKYYEVSYDPAEHAIMANDNASYWQDYLGYPAVAFLVMIGTLSYDLELAGYLKGIPWKDINQRYKNDFSKSLDEILVSVPVNTRVALGGLVANIYREVERLDLSLLGAKKRPPAVY